MEPMIDVYAVGWVFWWEMDESIWVNPKKLRHKGGVKRQNNMPLNRRL